MAGEASLLLCLLQLLKNFQSLEALEGFGGKVGSAELPVIPEASSPST